MKPDETIKFLSKDKIKNISVINFIRNNEVYSIDKLDQEIIIRGKSDRDWTILVCNNKGELLNIISRLTARDRNFAFVDHWMLPYITQNKKIVWSLETNVYYLPKKIKIVTPSETIRMLKLSDADIIYNNSDYKQFISLEYIQQRIKKGIGIGLIIDTKLVSWAITQDDNAIGFLHTLPEYRNMGFAKKILGEMIRIIQNKNELPFAYTEEGNAGSTKLLKSLGLIQGKRICWFEIK